MLLVLDIVALPALGGFRATLLDQTLRWLSCPLVTTSKNPHSRRSFTLGSPHSEHPQIPNLFSTAVALRSRPIQEVHGYLWSLGNQNTMMPPRHPPTASRQFAVPLPTDQTPRSEQWRQWPSVKGYIPNLPNGVTTYEIHKNLHRFGNVEYIKIEETRQGNFARNAFVTFK